MLCLEDLFSETNFPPFLWNSKALPWEPLLHLGRFFQQALFEIKSEIPGGVFLENKEEIAIGKNVLIEPGVFIKGPCWIGDHCVLRHGAYLRGEVILEEGAHVGHAAELKSSILLRKGVASHFCYVGDSILGSGVNLGAGVKCANLRLDQKEVSVQIEGKRVGTGLRKFGALVGDGSSVGCNAVLNPGTILYPGAKVAPLTSAKGVIFCV